MTGNWMNTNPDEVEGQELKVGIHNNLIVGEPITRAFHVQETAPTPTMAVLVDEGLFSGGSPIPTLLPAQTLPVTAPAANPRHDIVVLDSSGVASLVAGIEDPSPADPSLPSDVTALARLRLTTGMAAITSADHIDDLRTGGDGGAAFPGPSTELTVAAGSITPTRPQHTVDTENDDPTDQITSIDLSQIADESWFMLKAEAVARVVTIVDGGNIRLERGNMRLDSIDALLVLRKEGANAIEVTRATGGGGSGQILQTVFAAKTDTWSTTSQSGALIPGLTLQITPQKSTSKIRLRAVIPVGSNPGNPRINAAFDRDGSKIGVGAPAGSRTLIGGQGNPGDTAIIDKIVLEWTDAPATENQIAYGVQLFNQQTQSATLYVNRAGADGDINTAHRAAAHLVAEEIAA